VASSDRPHFGVRKLASAFLSLPPSGKSLFGVRRLDAAFLALPLSAGRRRDEQPAYLPLLSP
jgi:hypothetical protein